MYVRMWHYIRYFYPKGTFEVGAKMLMKDFTRKGGKMDNKWLEPYSITHCLGKGLYFLKAIDNPHVLVNGAHLNTILLIPVQTN